MFKDRDREIMSLMRENGLQIGDSLSILKTLKLEQKQEMLDWMIENDITRRVISVSLQSISKQARDIAKRKDLNYDDLLKLMDHITVKWNNFENKELYIDLELIMAMPGSTLEDFYEEFKFLKYCLTLIQTIVINGTLLRLIHYTMITIMNMIRL